MKTKSVSKFVTEGRQSFKIGQKKTGEYLNLRFQ